MDQMEPSLSRTTMDQVQEYLLQNPGKKVSVFVLPGQDDEVCTLNYLMKGGELDKNIPITMAKYRAQQKQLQIRVEIDQESRHFDSARAQEIGESSETFKMEMEESEQATMDSILMKSSTAQSTSFCRYMISHFKDGCVFFVPVVSSFNMNTDFSYLNPLGNDAGKKKDDEEEVEKIVTRKVARPENERMKKAKLKKTEEDIRKNEPWWNLDYLGSEREPSKAELERLAPIAKVGRASACAIMMSPDEYEMSFLKPFCLSRETSGTTATDESLRDLALSELKQMKLSDMIKAYMLNVNVASFTSMLATLTLNAAKQSRDALIVLHDVAVLVHGNWVVKSEILYPKGTFCGVSGLPAETLAKARTFILLYFAHQHEVKRTFIANETRLPSEEISGILKQFSRLDRRTGNWEFILPTDEDFIKRHHDDVRRQNMIWNSVRTDLEKEFKVPSKPLMIVERKRNSSTRGYSESQ